jgi:hypothetical protein
MATIGNFDAITGENEIIEITSAELKKLTDANNAEHNQRLAEKAAREADKAALLVKLGITADEAKLFLS